MLLESPEICKPPPKRRLQLGRRIQDVLLPIWRRSIRWIEARADQSCIWAGSRPVDEYGNRVPHARPRPTERGDNRSCKGGLTSDWLRCAAKSTSKSTRGSTRAELRKRMWAGSPQPVPQSLWLASRDLMTPPDTTELSRIPVMSLASQMHGLSCCHASDEVRTSAC